MAVITVIACTNHVHAQEFYRENETAMHIFHKLDRMFPKRYLEQRWMTGAQYWVQYWFEDQEDYEEHQPSIAEIFDQLNESHFCTSTRKKQTVATSYGKPTPYHYVPTSGGNKTSSNSKSAQPAYFSITKPQTVSPKPKMMPYLTKPSSQNSKNCSTNIYHAEKQSNKKCVSTEHTDV